jgi:hypothetical protein
VARVQIDWTRRRRDRLHANPAIRKLAFNQKNARPKTGVVVTAGKAFSVND